MEFFPEMELNAAQAEVIARGMLAVARADGSVHERELAMIQGFYGDSTSHKASGLAALENAPDIDPVQVAAAMSGDKLPKLFLKSCVLLGFADGDFSAKERTLVEKYAKALNVSTDALKTLEHSVKEFLLGHLAPLANTDAVTAVAKKLKLFVVLPFLLAFLGAALPGSAKAAESACANQPEVRFYHWAWNAQMGLMFATGGKQATPESLMCKHGVNLRLIREDNTDNMQALLATFAEGLKAGEKNPAKGAHFVAIMGDGSAPFFKGLNDKLKKLGPEYVAVVVGSTGYSRGEDKFMGPPEWKKNPQAARGGVVAGVLRDGDWNIAMKWLGDNKIHNNPDETTYDPNALNWVNASDYVEAAQKYVSGFCADLKNVKSGEKEKHCVNAVVTWTPGDVTVAKQKGGLVSIVSTREYKTQMPNVIIGNKKWMEENPKIVEGMLAAVFEGGDAVKGSDAALKKAAAVSATVYAEQNAAYWYRYFRSHPETDKQGLEVDLGGSAVSNLSDNAELFGLTPRGKSLFEATYTVFGNIVKSQYPELLPAFYPASEVTDLTYLKQLLDAKSAAPQGSK